MTADSGAAPAARAAPAGGVRQRALRIPLHGWRHSLNARFIVLSVVTNAARLLAAVVVLLSVEDIRIALATGHHAADEPMIVAALDRILITIIALILLHALADVAAYRVGRDLVSLPVIRILEATGAASPDAAARPVGPPADALTESLVRFRTARDAADEIARLNHELRDQVRELDAFTYSVSHDLRAPLRTIDGFAELLEQDVAAGGDAQARTYVAAIRDSSRRMNDLLGGLLALSRIGRDALRVEWLDPAAIVHAVLEEAGITADPNVELQLDPLPPCVADAMLLRQVYANLLQNAHKFSRDRRPARIHVGVRVTDGGGACYFVRDNGVGFENRHAQRVFGVFQRLHREDEFEGTGVGLAIADRAITRLGGRIWADGELGAGATFSFTLPDGVA